MASEVNTTGRKAGEGGRPGKKRGNKVLKIRIRLKHRIQKRFSCRRKTLQSETSSRNIVCVFVVVVVVVIVIVSLFLVATDSSTATATATATSTVSAATASSTNNNSAAALVTATGKCRFSMATTSNETPRSAQEQADENEAIREP